MSISYNDVLDKVTLAADAAKEAGYSEISMGLRITEYHMKMDQLEALAEAAAELELTAGGDDDMRLVLADMLEDQIDLGKDVMRLAEDIEKEIVKEDDELSPETHDSIEDADGGMKEAASDKKPSKSAWKKVFRKKATGTKKYLCHTGIQEEMVGRKTKKKAYTAVVKFLSKGKTRAMKRVIGYKTKGSKKPTTVVMNGKKLNKCSGKLA